MKNLISRMVFLTLLSAQALAGFAEVGDYKIDPTHTNVGFKVGHLGISIVVGRFNTVSGDVKLTGDRNSTISAKIDTASVDTNNERRDNHLRSGDFFNSNRFPKIEYVSSKMTLNGDGDPETIEGHLVLLGIRKPVNLKVQTLGGGLGPRGKHRIGLQAKGRIRRTDFGMNKFLVPAGDNVEIILNVELIKKN